MWPTFSYSMVVIVVHESRWTQYSHTNSRLLAAHVYIVQIRFMQSECRILCDINRPEATIYSHPIDMILANGRYTLTVQPVLRAMPYHWKPA